MDEQHVHHEHHAGGRGDGAYVIAASVLVSAIILSAVVLSVAGNAAASLQSINSKVSELKSAVALLSKPAAAPTALPTSIPTAGPTVVPSAPPAPAYEGTLADITIEGRPVEGEPSANFTLVEFSDFECPYCGKFFTDSMPGLEPFVESGELKIVFKQFPLDNTCNPLMQRQLHSSACRAATASLCAHEQGKFWEMHDKLFANQQALSADDLNGYAKGMGLEESGFASCLEANNKTVEIVEDIREGSSAGIAGTPAFLLYLPSRLPQERLSDIASAAGVYAQGLSFLESQDGKTVVRIVGALPADVFKAVLDNA